MCETYIIIYAQREPFIKVGSRGGLVSQKEGTVVLENVKLQSFKVANFDLNNPGC